MIDIPLSIEEIEYLLFAISGDMEILCDPDWQAENDGKELALAKILKAKLEAQL